MVTPFDEHGELDLDGAVVLAKWLSERGSEALVVAGSTGEGSSLDDREAAELFGAVAEAVTIPVIAATGTNNTRHTIHRTKSAKEAGVDAALVVTPYYARPSQAGLIAHFEAVAASTDLPILIYDIPIRAGRKVATETMLHLARDNKSIIGVKDAAADVISTARLAAEAPQGFDIYCGDDSYTLPMLAVGAVGTVSVAGHWLGPQLSEMIARFAKGDVEGAQQINARYLNEIAFQGSETYPNPLPAKAMCRAMGLPAGQCRLPMGDATAELDEQATKVLESISK
jgi:4-hydroxy-tetrahydrodipicolinate synthase